MKQAEVSLGVASLLLESVATHRVVIADREGEQVIEVPVVPGDLEAALEALGE